MNNSRPANITEHRETRRNDMDYKAMTKAILDQIDNKHVHRMIYEIVFSITIRLDQFAR